MNKGDKEHFVTRMKKIYGEDFEPLMQMAKNSQRLQKIADENENDADAQVEANKEWERISQFTTPKLKSVEHIGGDGMFEVHVHRGKE